MMTEFKKVFIDTAPIIYYLQSSELYYANMKALMKELQRKQHKLEQNINFLRLWMLYS